jgi:hydrogenase-4 component B
MVMHAFLFGTALLLLSGIPGLFTCRSSVAGERMTTVLVLLGSVLGATATVAALAAPAPPALNLKWTVPGGAFALALDGVSACFLLPLFLVSAMGAVYGLGYWPQTGQPATGRRLRLFYGLLAGSLALVMTARNGLFFLVVWEVMALAGFFLITAEEHKEEARRAGFIYLVATHTGTLALFVLFVLLDGATGSLAFPAAGTLHAPVAVATAIFLLALVGFGFKAGLMPLHVWLPEAHAAAPSHISAIMSGVMIKAGIYGLVRVTGFFDVVPPWWGWLILLSGAFSGVMGVAFAIAQHDIKRLLAYHSVENIGIIALGLGTALIGRSYHLPLLEVLGLSGALLHVINHGLFKSLLFLGAGSVIHATGTREIDHYGGLLRRLPWTGLLFLGGAVAISGLPPLNGFVSEWLIYLGLLKSAASDSLVVGLVVFAAPVLALIGALALACFVKVFGATFLGMGRTASAGKAHEAPRSMLLPMGTLAAACLLIGLFPVEVLPLLRRAAFDWRGGTALPAGLITATAPVAAITGTAFFFLLLLGAAALWLGWKARRGAASGPTWGCGYAFPGARMQYTSSSFAATLVDLFRWGLRPESHGGEVEEALPDPTEFSSHTPDTVLDRLALPLLQGAGRLCTWLRARLQHGIIGIYLMYTALALFALLATVTFLRG